VLLEDVRTVMRVREEPVDDAELQAWVSQSQKSRLSFFDFVRLDAHLASKRVAK
jgi:hypothetical protein